MKGNTFEQIRIKRISEKIGEKIYRFAKNKKNACIYIENIYDNVFPYLANDLCGSKINHTLKLHNELFFPHENSLIELKKKFDFILIIDAKFNQKQHDIKMNILDLNSIKITYYIPHNEVTHNDVFLFSFGGSFVSELFIDECEQTTLKSQYKYLERN